MVQSVGTLVPPSSCLIGKLAAQASPPVPSCLPPSNWRTTPYKKIQQQQGFNNSPMNAFLLIFDEVENWPSRLDT